VSSEKVANHPRTCQKRTKMNDNAQPDGHTHQLDVGGNKRTSDPVNVIDNLCPPSDLWIWLSVLKQTVCQNNEIDDCRKVDDDLYPTVDELLKAIAVV
jgi:hypothetical protein